MNPLFKKGDKVSLPYNETGTVTKVYPTVWWNTYEVKIRKSNGFNDENSVVDFFEKQIQLEQ